MELNWLLWLQSLATPWLDTVMGGITNLGSEYFYLAILCFLYWCVDVRGTLRLFVLFLCTVYLGGALKEIVGRLRPFQAFPNLIHARYTETAGDMAFPSGHALDATVFWGYLAMVVRRRWLYVVAPIVIVLVSFSRLYLGLHWPTDVLGGVLIGLLFLGTAYILLRLLAGMPMRAKFPVTLVLTLPPLLFFAFFPSHSSAQSMGSLFGALLGHLIERQYIHFPVRRPWWQQALKVVIGLAGVLLILIGLSAVLAPLPSAMPSALPHEPGAEPPLPILGLAGWAGEVPVLARYALVGLWASLLAPALFRLFFGPDKAER